MYPTVVSELPGAPEGMSAGAGFPGSRRVARELLTFPVTAELRGVELPFLECLAGILRREGALRPGMLAARPAPPLPPEIDEADREDGDWVPMPATGGEDEEFPARDDRGP